MKRLKSALVLTAFTLSQAWADDSGLAKGGAAYLNFSLGARAIAMGQAQAAVQPTDASVLYGNPAGLADLSDQSLTTTSGLLGLDRSLYFAAYALPFHKSFSDDDSMMSVEDADLGPNRRNGTQDIGSVNGDYQLLRDMDDATEGTGHGAFIKTTKTNMALAAGMTYFGIQNIEGRSEFGAREADFQDAEKAIYLAYAFKPYHNFGMGLTGKYLGQTLQSASANGFAFDIGSAYQVPYIHRGRLDFAFVAKDLGGSLKWTVPDPTLDTEFTYHEPVLTKLVFGTAYTSKEGQWVWALDLVKVSQQNLRTSVGVEWHTLSFLHLRAGASEANPSAGFGIGWNMKSMALQLDYAFQYDIHTLVNPSWLTLSLHFLPSK